MPGALVGPRHPAIGRQCSRHQDRLQGKTHEEQVGSYLAQRGFMIFVCFLYLKTISVAH